MPIATLTIATPATTASGIADRFAAGSRTMFPAAVVDAPKGGIASVSPSGIGSVFSDTSRNLPIGASPDTSVTTRS